MKVWDFENRRNGPHGKSFNMSQTVPLDQSLFCSAWSSNGMMVALSGRSGRIGVFHKSLGGGIQLPAVQELSDSENYSHCIVCLKFMPDNAILVSASSDGRLILWDPLEGNKCQMISLNFPIPQFVFSSHSQVSKFLRHF